MPSEEENVQYLYTVLTAGGVPTIDWNAVAGELNLNKGAATKRWSRLKQAMEKKTNPGPAAQQLLWLCVKHSAKDKAFDWNDIAAKCNTTAGAASKRYSRMKLAFENGAAAPPATPTKKGADKGTDGASPTKRKRGAGATAAKKSGDDGEGDAGAKVKEEGDAGEDEGEQEEEKPKAKRVRTPAKKKATVPKKTASTKAVKAEEEIQDELSAEHDDVKPAARSLFQELEDAVQNAQAKYHGGAGGLDGNLGGEDEDELVQARLRVESWIDTI